MLQRGQDQPLYVGGAFPWAWVLHLKEEKGERKLKFTVHQCLCFYLWTKCDKLCHFPQLPCTVCVFKP